MLNKQTRLDGISTLRFIAALGIMLYHIGFGNYYFSFIKPAMGTHLFLCISAFLFMYTTQKKTAGIFLKSRLIRVFPLYAILTVLTFLVAKYVQGLFPGGASLEELIKSLLFIPYSRGSIKSGIVVRPIVGPAWTLNYDVWFAIMFACSMKISKRRRGLISAGACIVAYGLGAILPKDYAISVFLKQSFWFDFIAGIMAYHVWTCLSQKTCIGIVRLSIIVAALSIVGLYFGSSNGLIQSMESFLILTSTLLFTANRPANKFINWFSNLSYSFYLIHYYVIIATGKVVDLTIFSAHVMWASVLVFVVSLLLSVCSYQIIEQWLCNTLKRLLTKTQA